MKDVDVRHPPKWVACSAAQPCPPCVGWSAQTGHASTRGPHTPSGMPHSHSGFQGGGMLQMHGPAQGLSNDVHFMVSGQVHTHLGPPGGPWRACTGTVTVIDSTVSCSISIIYYCHTITGRVRVGGVWGHADSNLYYCQSIPGTVQYYFCSIK